MNEFKKKPLLNFAANSIALVAGLVVLAVAVLLIGDHVRLLKMDPLNDPVLLELRDELAQSTGDNEVVVEKIRTYDLYARRAFFGNQEQRRTGGLLLLGAALVCIGAFNLSRHWKPDLPNIGKPDAPDEWAVQPLFRQLMAGTAIVLVVVSLFLAFATRSDLSVMLENNKSAATAGFQTLEKSEGKVPGLGPSLEELFLASSPSNWPSLRGPGNIGVAAVGSAPVSWDFKAGEGVIWTAEIYVHGYNSPIVWGDRVFLTGADEEGQEVFCFHADTGEELWAKTVETQVELPEVSEDTGLAASTMASDGLRVFAIFASGELAALDFDGNMIWQKNLGVPDNPYGMGSSLITDGARLFVQYDHNENQKVMALDCASGELVWETARTLISWATPALIQTENGPRLILNDEEYVTAYNPASGEQLWQVACLGGEVAPSPAFNGKGILFVGNEYAQATAFKLTGGEPEILWQYDDYLPEIASPLASGDLAFIPTSAGDIICLDIMTGEVKWEQEFDEGFSSSPVLVDGRIYIADLEGAVHILDASNQFNEIAVIETGEPVYATPAFANNRIYIRSDETLYCIGKKGNMTDE